MATNELPAWIRAAAEECEAETRQLCGNHKLWMARVYEKIIARHFRAASEMTSEQTEQGAGNRKADEPSGGGDGVSDTTAGQKPDRPLVKSWYWIERFDRLARKQGADSNAALDDNESGKSASLVNSTPRPPTDNPCPTCRGSRVDRVPYKRHDEYRRILCPDCSPAEPPVPDSGTHVPKSDRNPVQENRTDPESEQTDDTSRERVADNDTRNPEESYGSETASTQLRCERNAKSVVDDWFVRDWLEDEGPYCLACDCIEPEKHNGHESDCPIHNVYALAAERDHHKKAAKAYHKAMMEKSAELEGVRKERDEAQNWADLWQEAHRRVNEMRNLDHNTNWWKENYLSELHRGDSAERERDIAVEALDHIASWREGPIVRSSFDEPGSAEIARGALEKIKK